MSIPGISAFLWQGDLTLSYTIRDAAGNTSNGQITIPAPNAAPVTDADMATVVSAATALIDVLANDSDPEGETLSLVSAEAVSGTATITEAGLVSYTAPNAFTGSDTVTYEVSDPAGNTSQGTVSITVEAPNLPPEALDDTANAIAGVTTTIDVLANDSDPEGEALSLVEATALSGNVTVEADNTLSYIAPAEYFGTDTIGYTISDAAGNTSEGRVSVTVELPDGSPVAQDDEATVTTSGGSISIDVLANDVDPEGGALNVIAATAASGSVTIETDNMLTYTAPAEFTGTDTITYQIRNEADATDEGQVVVTVTALQITIDGDTELGDFAVEAKDGTFEVSIIEPIEYADTYTVSTADLPLGPVLLEQGQISGGTTAGGTVTATQGIWAGDESDGAITFTQQWYRGDEAINGATGTSHVITQGDLSSGLRLVQTATNAADARSVEAVVLEPAPVSTTFTENGVRFDAARLLRNADLAPADSQSVLYFVSILPHSIGRQGILRQDLTNHGVDIWDGQLRFRAPGGTAFTRRLTTDQRTNILAVATPNGSGTTLTMYSRFAGEDVWTEDSSISGNGPVDLTFGAFAVSGRPGAVGQNLDATVYRIACWSGIAPDISDPAVQAQFLESDGTLEDPELSRAAYGMPLVDLYGSAADYTAGVNNGAAGNFDTVEGTFTNA